MRFNPLLTHQTDPELVSLNTGSTSRCYLVLRHRRGMLCCRADGASVYGMKGKLWCCIRIYLVNLGSVSRSFFKHVWSSHPPPPFFWQPFKFECNNSYYLHNMKYLKIHDFTISYQSICPSHIHHIFISFIRKIHPLGHWRFKIRSCCLYVKFDV